MYICLCMYIYKHLYMYVHIQSTPYISWTVFSHIQPTTPPAGGVDPAAAASPPSYASRAGATPAPKHQGRGCNPV